jgi:hypothetical protein
MVWPTVRFWSYSLVVKPMMLNHLLHLAQHKSYRLDIIFYLLNVILHWSSELLPVY